MKMYTTLMTAYGVSAGISYKFHGTVANTLNSHRLIQQIQRTHGPVVASSLINSLYRQYFEEEAHPSATSTLLRACADAGIDEKEAEAVVADPEDGLREVKDLVREQKMDGVDSVPYVVVEGRRRDVTLVGAKEVEEYVKALEMVVKESG